MQPIEKLNLALIRKYDRPGPRYTSYPTAPAFSDKFGPDDFHKALVENNRDAAAPLSLYFHIPFCDTLCYFCACTTTITNNRATIRTYLDYLKREVAMVHKLIATGRKVTQLHWGGGTPSYLSPDEIRELAGFKNERLGYTDHAEVGVEIDPRGLTREHLKAFREMGFNRTSLGVQDFDVRVQQAVNRVQPEAVTRQAIAWARELGFGSINLDLIYGLPYQTVASFEKTVDQVIAYAPERIAVFNFAYVPWMKPHQKIIAKEALPSPEIKLDILKMTVEKFIAAGYVYIGMDHFAKPGDELAIAQQQKSLYRNFQGYSTRSGADLYSFGMSSISQFQGVYAQNIKEIPGYYAALDANQFPTAVGYCLNDDDHLRSHIITRLMCDMELTKSDVERKFNIKFDDYFAASLVKLKEFCDDGLLKITSDKISITWMGRFVVRNIAMCFDAYLDKMIQDKPVFSRTV